MTEPLHELVTRIADAMAKLEGMGPTADVLRLAADRLRGAKVKALVWDVRDVGLIISLAKIASYVVWALDGGRYALHTIAWGGESTMGEYETEDAAKAAAQADFERRVRECLEET